VKPLPNSNAMSLKPLPLKAESQTESDAAIF